MTKQIKISDELHQRLSGMAAEGYRSIGQQIELLLDQGALLDTTPQGVPESQTTPKKSAPTNSSRRTSKDVLMEINLMEQEKKNSVNQDPDYWANFAKRHQDLWDEYHSLEGEA